jgi:hypothetical protein
MVQALSSYNSDPLPWQCFARYSSSCKGVTFVDIDYKELMMKKRDVIITTAALNSVLTNMQVPLEGDVLLRSDEYAFPKLSPPPPFVTFEGTTVRIL